MSIRHSTEQDIPRMMEIFRQAREIMRADGNMNQWVNGYPSEAIVRNDIARGVSYVVEDKDGITGTFAFIPGVEPTYGVITGGEWLDDSLPYSTIHRLGSTKDSHGVAKACFDWCRTQDRNIRVDTHRDNRIMRHCIENAGFSYCGIIYLAGGDERLAYQRIDL